MRCPVCCSVARLVRDRGWLVLFLPERCPAVSTAPFESLRTEEGFASRLDWQQNSLFADL
jgi:hypothetical protein